MTTSGTGATSPVRLSWILRHTPLQLRRHKSHLPLDLQDNLDIPEFARTSRSQRCCCCTSVRNSSRPSISSCLRFCWQRTSCWQRCSRHADPDRGSRRLRSHDSTPEMLHVPSTLVVCTLTGAKESQEDAFTLTTLFADPTRVFACRHPHDFLSEWRTQSSKVLARPSLKRCPSFHASVCTRSLITSNLAVHCHDVSREVPSAPVMKTRPAAAQLCPVLIVSGSGISVYAHKPFEHLREEEC